MSDPEMFYKYIRMSPARYHYLLNLLSENLYKYSPREPVPPDERLMMILVFLASGCSQRDIALRFQRGRSTVSSVLKDTCTSLWDLLSPRYLTVPSSAEEWQQVAKEYFERWNFPYCVGCIDGKHFRIKCPKLSGSTFSPRISLFD